MRNRCAIGVLGKGIETKTLALWAKEFGLNLNVIEPIDFQTKTFYTCEEAVDEKGGQY